VLADVVESMTGVFYLQGEFTAALFIANELGIAPVGYMLNCASKSTSSFITFFESCIVEQANDGKDTWMRSLLEWSPFGKESLCIDDQKVNCKTKILFFTLL